MSDSGLPMYVIYEKPTDYPTEFVIRRWVVGKEGVVPDLEISGRAASLAMARLLIPPGMVPLQRFPDDDPNIVEVWL